MKRHSLLVAVFAIVFCSSLTWAISGLFSVSLAFESIVLSVTCLVVLLYLAARFYKASLGILIALALFALVAWRIGWFDPLPGFFQDYMDWVFNGNYAVQTQENQVFVQLSLWLLCLAFTLPLFVIVWHRASALLICLIGVAVFFGLQWMGHPFSKLDLLVFIMALLLYAVWISTGYAAPGQTARQHGRRQSVILLTTAPVCFLLVWAASTLPVIPVPLSEPVIDFAEAVFPQLSLSGEPKDLVLFSFGTTSVTGQGFGEIGAELGGESKLSPAEMLFHWGDAPKKLRGLSASTYTGRRWLNEDSRFTAVQSAVQGFAAVGYSNVQLVVLLNLMSGGLTPSPIDLDRGWMEFQRDRFEVQNISTQSLFLPPRVTEVDYDLTPTHQRALTNDADDVRLLEAVSQGYQYSTLSMVIRLTEEELEAVYRKSFPGYTARLLADLEALMFDEDQMADIEGLASFLRNEQEILEYAKAHDLQLPDTVTDRTRDLAARLTEVLETDYDRAKAIERYLSSSYPYTLKPPALPRDVDFVDHFLFEGKAGYCTYYATAMTVMCRTLGIPARYVEGFAKSKLAREDYFIVTGNEAHAWTEIYLDGVGWIAMEPTAPGGAGVAVPSPSVDLPEDDLVPVSPTPSVSASVPEVPSDGTDYGEQLRDISREPLAWITLAVAALLTWLCVQIVRRRRFLGRLRAQPLRAETVREFYAYVLSVYKRLGAPVLPGETPLEYGRRLDKILSLELDGSASAFMDSYCRTGYGEKPPDADDRMSMLALHKATERALNLMYSSLRVLLLRYGLGRV